MPHPTVIHFVRHGEVCNPSGIFYGRSPNFRLSSTGLFQAEKTAKILRTRNILFIFSSPLLRARQTAKIINSQLGQKNIKISSLLNEVYTPFDGTPQKDLIARKWDVYTGIQSQYEQPTDVLRRVKKFVQRMISLYQGQEIVAVTHADIIIFMALWASGYATTVENKMNLKTFGFSKNFPTHASITTLTIQENNFTIRYQQVME